MNAENNDENSNSNGGNSAQNSEFTSSESFEEECVICLEELSLEPWGRCTPCGHAFHKQCWWKWENAHMERVERQRARGLPGSGSEPDEGPKCCLCNTVNKQFVDGNGTPSHNPQPYVATDAGEANASGGGGGGRNFFDFLRGGRSPPRSPTTRQRGEGGRERGSPGSPGLRGAFQFFENLAEQGVDASHAFFDQLNGAPDSDASRSNIRRNGESNRGNGVGMDVRNFFEQFREDWGESPRQNHSTASASATADTNSNPYNTIRPGTPVVIQNLVNSMNLNGKRGKIMRMLPESERYLVRLDEDNSPSSNGAATNISLAVKPENLVQLSKVRIHGLQSQPQLNGTEGTVCSYSSERNRYVVRVGNTPSSQLSTREISIQTTNIRIPDGTCVRLVGLERQPQWNGRWGTIVRWEGRENGQNGAECGRYEVQLSRMFAVRVKMENVRL